VNSREIIARLQADGWTEVAQSGSHKQFRHALRPGRVTVPHPTKDMKIGTLKLIEAQSGLKLR
jgi:predicted RNA binding protein YcfA (HicA-like mRNA interferase family)